MIERDVVEKVLTDLRSKLRGALVIKHNDIGTKGFPDVAVHHRDLWSGCEFKHLKKGEKLKDKCKAEQLVFCHQLCTIHNGRCWIVVFEDVPQRMTVWYPQALFAHLWPNVAGPSEDGFKRTTAHVKDLHGIANLANVLKTYGSFRIDGWDYSVVSTLVTDYS